MTEGIEAVWPEYESLASLETGAGASSTLAPWVAREQVSSEGEVVVNISPFFDKLFQIDSISPHETLIKIFIDSNE